MRARCSVHWTLRFHDQTFNVYVVWPVAETASGTIHYIDGSGQPQVPFRAQLQA